MADRLPPEWEIDVEVLWNPVGTYRTFGYKPPGHRLRDVRLGWRDVRMRLGVPRDGSSPQKQQKAGLNQDRTLRPKRSTREQEPQK